MAVLTPAEALGQNYEPIQKHRFVLYLDGIPTWMVKRVKLPEIQNGEVELPFLNIVRYVKGKTRYSECELELFNPQTPSGSQYAMEWFRQSHQHVLGSDGYADEYKRDMVFNILSPNNEIVGEWRLIGGWIKNFNPGEFDYSSDGEQATISMTVRCDYMELNF